MIEEPVWNQSDQRVVEDAVRKRERVRAWLVERGLDGVVISNPDHFAWITSGGHSRVIVDGDSSVGHLVIAPDKQYLVAYYMDAERLLKEQVPDQGYELITVFWDEGDERLRAKQLAGKVVGADTDIPGTRNVHQELVEMQWPLTDLELVRYRWLGRQLSAIHEKLLYEVEPGVPEREVAKQLAIECVLRDVSLDVPILGSDERITKYRHVLATDKRIERYLLLGPVISRWGLHAMCSRSVHFGNPPAEVERAFLAAATIEGRIFAELREGLRFSAILDLQKTWYAELGYPDGWRLHFQGGPIGYTIVDPLQCLTENVLRAPQPFSWWVTVEGAKVEELSILTHDGLEIASLGEGWPTIDVETEHGLIRVPAMLIR